MLNERALLEYTNRGNIKVDCIYMRSATMSVPDLTSCADC